MSKFNTTIKKLSKIWENVEKNKYNLDTPIALKRILIQNHVFKPVFTIYDSDWQNIAIGRTQPSVYRTILNDNKNEYMLHSIPYLFRTSPLNILSAWIPFLNTSVRIKTIPTTEVVTANEYDIYGRESFLQIRVTGTVIYEDTGLPARDFVFTQTDIDNGTVNSDYLKPVEGGYNLCYEAFPDEDAVTVTSGLGEPFVLNVDELEEDIGIITLTTVYHSRVTANFGQTHAQNFGIIRPGTDENTIQVQSDGRFSIGAKTTQSTFGSTTDTNYSYSWVMPGGYDETSDEDTSSFHRYSIPDQDVQIKFIVTLQNPFFYRTETNVQS